MVDMMRMCTQQRQVFRIPFWGPKRSSITHCSKRWSICWYIDGEVMGEPMCSAMDAMGPPCPTTVVAPLHRWAGAPWPRGSGVLSLRSDLKVRQLGAAEAQIGDSQVG